MTESAATWSVKASVPVILGVWKKKNHMSRHYKLALFKSNEMNDHSRLAEGLPPVSGIPPVSQNL